MMLADAEVAIGYFLAMLLAVLIPACIALIGCQLGCHNWLLVGCALVPILFAVYLSAGGIFAFFHGWLVAGDPVDLGLLCFPLGLSAPLLWAGCWTLVRMKRNKMLTK
jgi:hypothetical protein